MTDPAGRDPVIADALESIPVPDYEPGFWDRLDARLSAEGFPGLDVASLDAEPSPEADVVPTPVVALVPAVDPIAEPSPEPVVAELAAAAPAARRRGLALLGAAAAVVVAVLTLQLTDGAPSDPIETAADGARTSLRAPGGGSTTAGAGDDGAPAGTVGDEDAQDDDPTLTTAGDASGGVGPGAAPLGAGGGAPASGTVAVAPPRGEAGAKDTPQDAFTTWAASLQRGDVDAALALTGPRTVRYHAATGTDSEDAAASWAAAYGTWADGKAGRIDALDAPPSDGAAVVVLLLDRPDPRAPDGRARAAIPMVQSRTGWLVEPEAWSADDAQTLALAAPADGEPRHTVPRDHVIEVAAAEDGAYTLALDRSTTTTVAASTAVDGVIRWDPPDTAMTPGPHVLVVVHVTDDTITTLTTAFEVA